ncbi:MAG: hypothetical protein LBL62_06935 [Planctomycetaceae bacterium]|jgi:hypothetical protein|nr:hypothetical protein [Planctomycetaceae bacterium]
MKRFKKIIHLFFICIFSWLSVLYAEDSLYKKTDLFLRKKDKFTQELAQEPRNNTKNYIDRRLKDQPDEFKSLFYALAHGDFKTANSLKTKVDLHAVDSSNENILLRAVDSDPDLFSDQIRWITENGIDIDVLWHVGEIRELQADGTYKITQIYQTYIEMVSGPSKNWATLVTIRPDLVHKRNSTTGKSILENIVTYSRNELSIEVLLASDTDEELNRNDIHNPVVQAVLAGEYANALILLAYGARDDITFEHQKETYTSILDFFKRYPKSIEEDINYAKNADKRSTQSTSYKIKMKAKIAIRNLLESRTVNTNR